MRVNIIMPKMGESLTEGTIIKWHKKVGDSVQKDEIIFEIATDKVDTEIPSPDSGKIVEIRAFEQETVEVNAVVAVLETDGEAEMPAESNEQEIQSTNKVGGKSVDIIMPKMGESVMEGTIIKWHKKIGDSVLRDEILFEISTDKVDTEVPSPVDGILKEILFNENDTAAIDTVVARISTTGGIVKADSVPVKAEENKKPEIENKPEIIKKTEKTNILPKPQSGRFYSPLVMNIARKENISMNELDIIKGTGLKGRVTKKDILSYIEERKSGGASKTAAGLPDVPDKNNIVEGDRINIIPMDNIRRRIMENMIASRDTSVHVSQVMDVDVTNIYNFLKKNKQSILDSDGIKLTYMSFIAYTVVRALKEFPLVNSSIDGENILRKKYINLGFAVAVEPNGLIVPNIKNADSMNVRGLAKAISELSSKARSKGLTMDDISDGTFSITNYGVFGALHGNPIINQPEAAILGVGAVKKQPVVVEIDDMDTIAVKPILYLSLSHDHRLIDGMLGGKFLKFIKDSLEKFDTSIV